MKLKELLNEGKNTIELPQGTATIIKGANNNHLNVFAKMGSKYVKINRGECVNCESYLIGSKKAFESGNWMSADHFRVADSALRNAIKDFIKNNKGK